MLFLKNKSKISVRVNGKWLTTRNITLVLLEPKVRRVCITSMLVEADPLKSWKKCRRSWHDPHRKRYINCSHEWYFSREEWIRVNQIHGIQPSRHSLDGVISTSTNNLNITKHLNIFKWGWISIDWILIAHSARGSITLRAKQHKRRKYISPCSLSKASTRNR